MDILTLLRKAILENAATAAKVGNRVYMTMVPQDALRPNINVMMVSGTEDWTHDGPDGMHRQTVRVYSRGDTAQDARLTRNACHALLQGLVGTDYGMIVHMCQHTASTADYQDDAKVYRQIDDYRIHFSYA